MFKHMKKFCRDHWNFSQMNKQELNAACKVFRVGFPTFFPRTRLYHKASAMLYEDAVKKKISKDSKLIFNELGI
jgi:hypothetical protein